MLRIVILGTGNVATHLYTALKKSDTIEIVQVYSRTPKSLLPFKNEVATTSSLTGLVEADLYIIAVSDDAIASIAHNLPFNDRLVVHTSGSVPMINIHKRNRRGVLYPLQTFTKKKAVDFSSIPICLEFGHKKDFVILEQVVRALGSPLYKITSDQRKRVHLAAVFVNNFSNHLYRIGHEICDTSGVEFEILKPLIQETAAKIETVTPYMAQTGPAKRGDEKTIERHIDLLENDMHKNIYSLLTTSIKNTYGK